MGGGAAAEPKIVLQTYPWQVPVASFLVYAGGNLGLNYFNKWALDDDSYPGFDFPVFYTMFHMLASQGFALVMMLTCAPPKEGGYPTFGMLWLYRDVLIPISICTFLNTALNNKSLTQISLFTNQVIKATGPAPTIFFSYVIARITYSWSIILTVLVLVGGCILANADSFGDSDSDNEIGGIITVVISTLAASVKPVIAMVTMADRSDGTAPRPKLAPEQILFFDAGLAFWYMFLYWVSGIDNERQNSINYLAGKTCVEDNCDLGLVGVGIIAAGCSMAVLFNLATYYFVKSTSALSSTVGSNFMKIVIICITGITDGVGGTAWGGVAIVGVSIGVYAYLTYTEKQAKEAAKAAGKTATEATPLSGNTLAVGLVEAGSQKSDAKI